MSESRNPKLATILSAAAATSTGNTIFGIDHRNILIEVTTAGFTGTVKLKGALGNTPPDFSASASATNAWDTITVVPYADTATPVAGATGLVFSGDSGAHIYELNTNDLDYFTAGVTAYTAGTVTVKARLVNNQ